ncbi:hypothetical protein BMETH_1023_0 [methanotrophic bacterial endosymbiont of Bathymodiolus sp.]|nr:hypothetical protein BMETH_1023_0 [methanotrophic bacterial endosymbiont of Bathymodiolus sp.]
MTVHQPLRLLKTPLLLASPLKTYRLAFPTISIPHYS